MALEVSLARTPRSDGAERLLQDGATAAIERRHQSGDVVRTVQELFAMLVDSVCFPYSNYLLGTDMISRLRKVDAEDGFQSSYRSVQFATERIQSVYSIRK